MRNYDKSCTLEHRIELEQDLRYCEYCTTSLEDHNRCRQQAASKHGENARECLED